MLIGNLGRDPELRTLESGTSVANFTMATTESYRDRNSGERVDQTEWHNITLWRGLADTADKYLKKGDKVYIEGKIRSRTYTDKEGIERRVHEVVADNMVMLGRSGGDSNNQGGRPAYGDENNQRGTFTAPEVERQEQKNVQIEDDTDDLPF